VSGIDPDELPQPSPRAPWAPDEEPEPAWADAIRRGRKARGDRLREVFDRFGDEGSAASDPTRRTSDEVDVS
jgi:hypothetical protein